MMDTSVQELGRYLGCVVEVGAVRGQLIGVEYDESPRDGTTLKFAVEMRALVTDPARVYDPPPEIDYGIAPHGAQRL